VLDLEFDSGLLLESSSDESESEKRGFRSTGFDKEEKERRS